MTTLSGACARFGCEAGLSGVDELFASLLGRVRRLRLDVSFSLLLV